MIGDMCHRITIQNYTESRDDVGELIRAFTDYRTVWASLQVQDNTEKEEGKKDTLTVTHRFTIRWDDGVTTNSQILFRGGTFTILSVTEKEQRKRYMEIIAEKKT